MNTNTALPIRISDLINGLGKEEFNEGKISIELVNKLKCEKIETGFTNIDKIIGGFRKDELIVIGGRPAMGKTALILSIIAKIIERKTPVVLFSIESSWINILNALLSNYSGISINKIRYSELSDQENKRIIKVLMENICPSSLYIDDTSSINIESLCNKIRKAVELKFVEIVFIDYLQMIYVKEKSFDTRYAEINYITRQLKLLAKELHIPIVLTSQLNRNLEERDMSRRRPLMTDFRDSGTICDDADLACFLYRPEYYNIAEDERGNSVIGVAEFIIAKQRFGDTGTALLKLNPSCCKFEDYKREELATNFEDVNLSNTTEAPF